MKSAEALLRDNIEVLTDLIENQSADMAPWIATCLRGIRVNCNAALSHSQAQGVTITDEMVERALDAFYGPIWRGAPGPRLLQAEMRGAIEAAFISTPTDRGNA